MIRVDIQVQNGKVTICVGGPSSTTAAGDEVVSQGEVAKKPDGGKGGGLADEDPGTGGGVPGSGGLVIGPVVIGCGSVAQDGSETTARGGADEDPGTGGGVPGCGCLVIGPVVVCGSLRSAAQPKKPSQEVSVPVPKP